MAALRKRRLLIFTNTAEFFLSHRKDLASLAQQHAFDVSVATPPSPLSSKIEEFGLTYVPVSIGRRTWNPLGELLAILSLYRTLKNADPDVIHTFTIKPNIYSAILLPFLKAQQLIITITGLGSSHLDKSLKGLAIRSATHILYNLFLRQERLTVVFQNQSDMQYFARKGWVSPDHSLLIPGTGVNTDVFHPPEYKPTAPQGPIQVLFPSRLLKDKGLMELIEAGRLLATEGFHFKLVLCGRHDLGNPSSISVDELETIKNLPFVNWLGQRDDMPDVYRTADIVSLPSYREGLSLSLLEAAASGLPIVTTNVPGCREIVEHGANGYLAEPRNVPSLANQLRILFQSETLRTSFGKRSREFILKNFKANVVMNRYIDLYKSNLYPETKDESNLTQKPI